MVGTHQRADGGCRPLVGTPRGLQGHRLHHFQAVPGQADLAYFEALLHGVLDNRRDIDEALGPYLDRGIEEVDAIERAVLRLAAYELRYRLDVPYRVVINEAIESAKRFGSEHGHTYVNGVLDRAAVEWRKVESGH